MLRSRSSDIRHDCIGNDRRRCVEDFLTSGAIELEIASS